MGASTTADISMIVRRSKAYFYENIYVVYKDNRGKLRFTIKVKMHLRFTRNGRLRFYEDNKFPFTVYEDNKSAFTVYENTSYTTEGEQILWWRFDDELWTRFVYVVFSAHISDMEIVK